MISTNGKCKSTLENAGNLNFLVELRPSASQLFKWEKKGRKSNHNKLQNVAHKNVILSFLCRRAPLNIFLWCNVLSLFLFLIFLFAFRRSHSGSLWKKKSGIAKPEMFALLPTQCLPSKTTLCVVHFIWSKWGKPIAQPYHNFFLWWSHFEIESSILCVVQLFFHETFQFPQMSVLISWSSL